jgi:hypothetical protein
LRKTIAIQALFRSQESQSVKSGSLVANNTKNPKPR